MNPLIRLVLRAGSTLAFSAVPFSAALLAQDAGPQPAPGAGNPNGVLVHEARPYVLFMGADVAVEQDKVFRPINEVTSTVVVINADGKPVNVPLARSLNLQVREDLKVSASSVAVADLASERVYSQAADPFRKLESFNSAASGAVNVEDLARGQLLKDQVAFGANPAAGPSQQAEIAKLAADQSAVDVASTQSSQAVGMLGDVSAREGAAASGGGYDAIRVSFTVTPKADMAKAYVAIIAQIRDPANKAGQDQAWIHVQSLGALSAGDARKVGVYEEGLPPGYALDKCEVHLYDGRNELATNLSDRRVLLTKDEMLDFRVIEYIAANNGRTLPAAPATFAKDLRASLSPAELNQACFVRVAKDGRVAAAFVDRDGTQPLQDPELDAALKGLRFKPAIDAGKPVESVVAIRLGALAPPRG
jgi:hypothetical protein